MIFTALLLLLLPTAASARNLFEMGLGVSGIYDTGEAVASETFFDGMVNGENWTIGIGLNTRLSIVNLSLLAEIPNGGEVAEDLFSLRSTLVFDIPLVNDHLYVNAGAGLSTHFATGEGSGTRVNGRSTSDATFEEALVSSTIHMKAGLDLLVGSVKFGLFYLLETPATIEGMGEGRWSDVFRTNGDDRMALMVQLALF